MIQNDIDMRSYRKRVNEFIKVLEYQMQFSVGMIELNDYTKVYNLNKTQMLKILEEKKVLKRLNEYNKKFKPAT